MESQPRKPADFKRSFLTHRMTDMPTRIESSIDAHGSNGITYQVDVHRRYTTRRLLNGTLDETVAPLADLMTSCGQRLEYLSKGKYRI